MLQNDLNINSDCSNFHSLPDIKIKLKSRKGYKSKELVEHEIVLKPSDYLIEGNRIKNNFKGIENEFLNLINEECQPAFMPIDVPAPRGPIFVFGEYFMKKFYTVFDRDQNVVGLSIANHKQINEDIAKISTPYDHILEVIASNNKNENETHQDNINNNSVQINNINNLNKNINENNNSEESDFKKFMDSFSENSKQIEEDILPENFLKESERSMASKKPTVKKDYLNLDLNIEEDKNSNFLLNYEFVKLTKDDINNVHLDLGLFSETSTKSYLNDRAADENNLLI